MKVNKGWLPLLKEAEKNVHKINGEVYLVNKRTLEIYGDYAYQDGVPIYFASSFHHLEAPHVCKNFYLLPTKILNAIFD